MSEENSRPSMIDLIARAAHEGYLNIVTFENDRPVAHSFHVSELSAAKSFAARMGSVANTYAETSLQRAPAQPGCRGTVAGAVHLAILTLDFDVKGPGHSQQDLPDSLSDFNRLIEKAAVPDPTILLSTGGGGLAVWALEEPLSDMAKARLFSEGFQSHLRRVARQCFGWTLDRTSDLARLVRLEGTLNHKYTPPHSVRAVG
jgi:hypothetical protein